MTAEEFVEYLSRFLGRSVAPDEVVTLTSGQQARAAGWLSERGFVPADLRSRLGGAFTAAKLLGEATAATSRRLPEPQGADAAGIGIDIQRIDELIPAGALADLKSSPEVTAIFTLREISYAQSRPRPDESLAGLFAAKEALRKCDAALLAKALVEIEILPDAAGRPQFPGFAVSIAHSGGFAVAVAVRGSSR